MMEKETVSQTLNTTWLIAPEDFIAKQEADSVPKLSAITNLHSLLALALGRSEWLVAHFSHENLPHGYPLTGV
jgi:hypothetical protein